MRKAVGIFAACALAAVTAFASPVHAEPPRASDGRPDLQGVWDANFITALERPDGYPQLVLSDEQVKKLIAEASQPPEGVYDPDFEWFVPDKLLVIDGKPRSSWITEPSNGQLPLTTLARSAVKQARENWAHGFDNPEERPTGERCVSGFGNAPLHAISLVIPHQIVQTAGDLLIVTEDTDSGRIIHLNGQAPPDALRSRSGYSAGRWDGDTLVVETSHLAARDPSGVMVRSGVVVAEGSRIVERFTLKSENELLYQFTVEDPTLYSQPWSAEYVLTRLDDRLSEYACNEGNRGITYAMQAARLGRQPKK